MPWKTEFCEEIVPEALSGNKAKGGPPGSHLKQGSLDCFVGKKAPAFPVVNQAAKKKSKSKQIDDEEESKELDPLEEYLTLSKVELREEIETLNFEEFTTDVQAILINPDWNLNKKEGSLDEGVSIHQFKKLKFTNKFVSEGIIFVWVEKEIMSEVIVHMD